MATKGKPDLRTNSSLSSGSAESAEGSLFFFRNSLPSSGYRMTLLVRSHEQGLDSLLPAEFDDRLRVPLGVSFRDDDTKVASVKSCRERAHICGENPVTLRLAFDRVREL
ncbi:MAG: hypothetical protein E6K84_07270 [Thaumarchaeota archaeon]|nr:MAG: hypothetical protein E6K84_07270 [Nitrososphaerota archaeon]